MEWRPVVGYEKLYEVSENGDVRRLGVLRKCYVTPIKIESGYLQIRLFRGGKKVHRVAHRLVAEAFLPKPEGDDLVVNHKDSDRANNRVSNLEWVTRKENSAHAARNGRLRCGENNRHSKLNAAAILEIFALKREGGWNNRKLGAKFNTSGSNISRILRGLTWSHVVEREAELMQMALGLADPWMVGAGIL